MLISRINREHSYLNIDFFFFSAFLLHQGKSSTIKNSIRNKRRRRRRHRRQKIDEPKNDLFARVLQQHKQLVSSKHKSLPKSQKEIFIVQKRSIPVDVFFVEHSTFPADRSLPSTKAQWQQLIKSYSTESVGQIWQPLSQADCAKLYQYATKQYQESLHRRYNNQ